MEAKVVPAPRINLEDLHGLSKIFNAIDDQKRFETINRWQKSDIEEGPKGIPICRVCRVPTRKMIEWLDLITKDYAFVHPYDVDIPDRTCEEKFLSDKEGLDETIIAKWPFRAQIKELVCLNRYDKQKGGHLSMHPYDNVRPIKSDKIICITQELLDALKSAGIPIQTLAEPDINLHYNRLVKA